MNAEDFERVLQQGRELQAYLPDLELVAAGGTAAAVHCRHRFSQDVDCVTPVLQGRFSEVVESLERWEGWKTNRRREPVMVLGERGHVELGVRQLRRHVPLQTVSVNGLRVPTPRETLRIKAFLCAERRATRDFIDTAALICLLGDEESLRALSYLNLVYESGTNQTPVVGFAEACEIAPADLELLDIRQYKGIRPPCDDWQFVESSCRRVSRPLLKRELENRLPGELDQSFYESSRA